MVMLILSVKATFNFLRIFHKLVIKIVAFDYFIIINLKYYKTKNACFKHAF